jgi:biopolymer transport protein ExbD
MADIAFLLMIFFLVTTTLNRDKGIGMALPPMGETKPVPRKNICHIWINASGEVAVEGDIIPLSTVRQNVKNRIAANANLVVSVQADQDTDYGVFVDVLDELKLADARRISIASPQR